MASQILNAIKKTSIGGQALIEGVMMRGPYITAMSVRKPDGNISTETWNTNPAKWYSKVPLIRGVVNMISSLLVGYKCLMKSAEISGTEETDDPPSKLDLWIEKHLGDKMSWIFNIIVTVFSLAISVGLFMLLPSFLVQLVSMRFALAPWLSSTIEGLIKIAVFILYLLAVTRMKDIHRVYEYHGAEHKTIACYEAGDELTPENAMKHSRFHPRCGTSFLLIVLVISILVFSVVTWSSLWMRMLLKLALLPVVVGLSYEVIRFAGRYNNWFTRIISAPGLWLQRLTTFEPDMSQLEIAIAAMKPCIPDDGQDNY